MEAVLLGREMKISAKVMKHPKIFLALAVIVVLAVGAGAYLNHKSPSQRNVSTEAPEITLIKKINNDVPKQALLYRKLIERVGPDQAQELLYRSGLPFTGQTHLLNHTVGEYLYEKYGDAGLVHCKDYFLSSCYHGFVLNIISSDPAKTMRDIKSVMQTCDAKAAYVAGQCSHAIGHGFLAAEGYKNLPQALSKCDEVAAQLPNFPVVNCWDGVFMENIWGVHDGKPSPDRWVNPQDLHFPCDSSQIDSKYLRACWMEQPSLIFQYTGGDIAATAEECVAAADILKDTCYDSLARQVHPLTKGDVQVASQMCKEFGPDRIDGCLTDIMGASLTTGDTNMPSQLCQLVSVQNRSHCNEQLVQLARMYYPKPVQRNLICGKIQDATYRKSCSKA